MTDEPAVLAWAGMLRLRARPKPPRPRVVPCSPRHRSCSAAHRALVLEYRDARDAREALRERDSLAPTSVPGTAGSAVAYYQLDDDEFDRAVPKVLFKDWLIGHARPADERWAS